MIAAKSSNGNRLLRRLNFALRNTIDRSNERENLIRKLQFYFNERDTAVSALPKRCGEILVDTRIYDAHTYAPNTWNPLFLTTDTAEECASHCDSLPTCVAWTYRGATCDCNPMVHVEEKPGTYIGYKSGFCNAKSSTN
ncbi:hypothetical protein I4U23_016924 [Adineta vaga]|nr:hypothetical protein I4U23_016924 [Adineta vaga]